MLSEPNTPPFKFGDVVEHGAGVRIVVKQCSLQVQHERTRWIIDGEDGNRYFAKNCRMVVPSDAVTLKGDPEEFQVDLDIEPVAQNDKGEFVGVSAINGAAVYAERSPVELFVASLTLDVARCLSVFQHHGDCPAFRSQLSDVIRKELCEIPLMPVSQHKATDDVRKEHIETLRAKVAELEERSKEANAELVRAAQTSDDWKAKAEKASELLTARVEECAKLRNSVTKQAGAIAKLSTVCRSRGRVLRSCGKTLAALRDERSRHEDIARRAGIEALEDAIFEAVVEHKLDAIDAPAGEEASV